MQRIAVITTIAAVKIYCICHCLRSSGRYSITSAEKKLHFLADYKQIELPSPDVITSFGLADIGRLTEKNHIQNSLLIQAKSVSQPMRINLEDDMLSTIPDDLRKFCPTTVAPEEELYKKKIDRKRILNLGINYSKTALQIAKLRQE